MKTKTLVKGAALVMALGSALLSVKMVSAAELESVGTFDEGVQVGLRNGGLIAQRVQDKIMKAQGCDGLTQLQQALAQVSGNIQAPVGSSSKFVAGFYKGYLQAIGTTLKNARDGCGVATCDDGGISGEILGNALTGMAAQLLGNAQVAACAN